MNKGENPIIILLVVAALAVLGLWSLKNKPVVTVEYSQTIPYSGSVVNNLPTNAIKYVPASPYAQALLEYGETRIQLDKNCQAIPSYVTYKNHTIVMIDNRSEFTRTIKLGSTFTLEPYGFKVVQLTSPIVPMAWYLDCDTSQNVATILIQK